MPGRRSAPVRRNRLGPDAREREIRRLRQSCGCTSGMVVMLVVLAVYVALQLRAPSPGIGLTRQVLTGSGLALAGAVVGKLAGLLWAHLRLNRLLRTGDRS